MELNLKGRVALVTGGGTGIGAGIRDYLAEEGGAGAVNYGVGGPAGQGRASELARSDANWDRVIDVNLNGPFYLARRVARHLVEEGRQGTIVNISSKSGFQLNTGGRAH